MKTPAGFAVQQLLPLALLGLVGLVVWSRIRPGAGGGGLVQEVAATVASSAGDAAAGVVLGVGDSIGLPRTNETECQKALREGRMWDASFACPAADFIKGAVRAVADGSPSEAGPVFRGAGASGSW